MLACADIEEGDRAAPARGVRVPILVFGALSVSDLDGVFEHDLTPTISTPARGARAAGGGRGAAASRSHCHLKIDTGMNRLGFRHDNLDADAARGRRQPRTSRSTPSTRTSRPPTIPEHPLFAEQRDALRARR